MSASPSIPRIFDTGARALKLARARRGPEGHDFLHRLVGEDLNERLESILRAFAAPVFTGPGATILAQSLTPRADVATPIILDDPDEATSLQGLAADSADLLVSSMGLHAVNDLPGALRAARRALRPDGLFLAAFPAERTLIELRHALQQAEAEVTGRVGARVMPFVAVKDGGALLQHAGFALPVADVLRWTLRYPSPAKLIADLRGMGETSCLLARPRGALRRDVWARAWAMMEAASTMADVAITVEILVLTGFAPHPAQPVARAPGSAKASLAAAIRQHSASD